MISDYIQNDKHKKTLNKIYSGSWIDKTFQYWIGESTKNKAWSYLKEARDTFETFVKENKDNPNIENAYKELIKLNEEGLIKIYLYPERPSRIPNDNSDLINKVIKWQKNGFDINKFYKLYPELKDKFLQISSE